MAEDEELLESRHWQPTRRTVVATAVVAVVLAGGAVLLTRTGDDGTPAAAPTTAPTTSAAPSPITSVVAVPRPVCLDVGDSALNCGVSATVPREVLTATRSVLPKATVVSSTTVTGRDGRVVSRRVLVQDAAGSTLWVRIGVANGQQGGSSVNGLNDGLSVQYGTDVGRRHVEISVRTPPGRQVPAVAALQKLAVDPRLFTVR